VGPCPQCDGSMFLISFKDSRFLGCTKRCGYTHSVPKTGKLTLLDKTCETCGWKLVRLKEEGDSPEIDFCLNRRCTEGQKYWKQAGSRTVPRGQAKASAASAVSAPRAGAGRTPEAKSTPESRSTERKVESPASGRVSKLSPATGRRKESK